MLRTMLSMAIVIALLGIGGVVPSYAIGETYVIGKGEGVLKSHPSAQAETRKKIPLNTRVKSLERQGEWFRVISLTDGEIGWIGREDLKRYVPLKTKPEALEESKGKEDKDLAVYPPGSTLIITDSSYQSISPQLLEIYGELKNVGEKKSSDIRIKFKVMGYDNRILKIDSAYLNPKDLEPGESGTFTKIINKANNLSYISLAVSWISDDQAMRSPVETRVDIPLDEAVQTRPEQESTRIELYAEIDEIENYLNNNAEILSDLELDDFMERLKSAQISLLTLPRSNLTSEYLQKIVDKINLIVLLKERLQESKVRSGR